MNEYLKKGFLKVNKFKDFSAKSIIEETLNDFN